MTVDPSTETAMSEPGVTRPGEAAAVEQAENITLFADWGTAREFAERIVNGVYATIAAAVRAEERERIAARLEADAEETRRHGRSLKRVTDRRLCELQAVVLTRAARLAREEPTDAR